MDKWVGCVAVVTGASSGIGRAITIKLAEEGMKVAALARREDRLKELASSFKGKGEIKPFKCDVSDEAVLTETFSQIEQKMGPVRVLVNNAGISLPTRVSEFDINKWKRVFDVNVFSMFSCIGKLMASIKKRASNDLVQVININSVVGHTIVSEFPLMMVYTCSKQCVTLLTRRLIKEIAEDKLNVRVTSLSPGAVETEILDQDGKHFDFTAFAHLEGSDIADAAVAVLKAPENVIISELTIKPKGEVL